MKNIRKIFLILLGVVLAGFFAIQLVPYGRNHQNPPVSNPYQWNDPQAEQIARRACYDCHSNETVWPWYSSIAPGSWLIQKDVEEGRQYLNFSTSQGVSSGEIGEVLQEGDMPPPQYLLLHPNARLSTEEKSTLINGMK